MTEANSQGALPPVIVRLPEGEPLPLVCDSPHSGTTYPADFGAAIPAARLRGGEDTHVDALWAAVPAVGGTLLAATFPRVYIDPNRMADDIDPKKTTIEEVERVITGEEILEAVEG